MQAEYIQDDKYITEHRNGTHIDGTKSWDQEKTAVILYLFIYTAIFLFCRIGTHFFLIVSSYT